MNVYLNDWSCPHNSQLSENTAALNRFLDLIKALKATNICELIIDRKPASLTIADYPMEQCYRHYDDEDCHNADLRAYLLSIFDYFSINTGLDTAELLCRDGAADSVLLGNAHAEGCPAVSFCFNPLYEAATINGHKNRRPAQVANLHTAADIAALSPLLYSRTECRKHDPLTSPLWNVEATSAYMAGVEADLVQAIKTNPDEKIKLLTRHSTIVANLNGWVLDERLTRLNNSSTAHRRIFRADGFCRTAYLSIDFEKVTVHFELHNKKGRHLGQLKWDGNIENPDTERKHDIRV
ncbi:MAG: hypothetical protein NC418_06610 [Muribaculaceae bacterium]|nr:hypothetical protein [Muribaculaceae bacterium]